jgi:hypothetical protein
MNRWMLVVVLVLLVLTSAMGLQALANSTGPMPPTPWLAANSTGPMPPTPWANSTGPMPPTPW